MFLYVSQNGQKIPTDEKYVEKTATTDSKNRVPTTAEEGHAVTRGTVLYERTPLHIHTKKTPYTTILQKASRGFVSDSWAFLLDSETGLQALRTLLLLLFLLLLLADLRSAKAFFHFITDRRQTLRTYTRQHSAQWHRHELST